MSVEFVSPPSLFTRMTRRAYVSKWYVLVVDFIFSDFLFVETGESFVSVVCVVYKDNIVLSQTIAGNPCGVLLWCSCVCVHVCALHLSFGCAYADARCARVQER